MKTLEEIRQRLDEIRKELKKDSQNLTEERLKELDEETRDLKAQEKQLIEAEEKRQQLLKDLAEGRRGSVIASRNFGGASDMSGDFHFGGYVSKSDARESGAGEEREAYTESKEYRTAFMNYTCRNTPFPAEVRENLMTTVGDAGAVVPSHIMNRIIQKAESYGNLYAKFTKTDIQGGVSVPIADLKPEAHWITEEKPSGDQNLKADKSIVFNYHGLECKIAQSILANVVTLEMFEKLFVPLAAEAMVKAIEISFVKGTGNGQPLGITKDKRIIEELADTNIIEMTEEDVRSWSGWHKKVKAKIKKAYRAGEFIMNQATYDGDIEGMEDKSGQPVARTNYGLKGGETYRFMGKTVETVDDDVLPSYEDAEPGEVFAIFMKPSDYVINSNMKMTVTKWTDHDNNKVKNKCMAILDGKAADVYGILLIKKAMRSI